MQKMYFYTVVLMTLVTTVSIASPSIAQVSCSSVFTEYANSSFIERQIIYLSPFWKDRAPLPKLNQVAAQSGVILAARDASTTLVARYQVTLTGRPEKIDRFLYAAEQYGQIEFRSSHLRPNFDSTASNERPERPRGTSFSLIPYKARPWAQVKAPNPAGKITALAAKFGIDLNIVPGKVLWGVDALRIDAIGSDKQLAAFNTELKSIGEILP